MASNPLEFLREAEEEYLSALAWYRERSPTAAFNFESAFARAIRTISQAPHRWPIYLAGCRRYAIHQFPFIIVYSAVGSHIVVLAVAHGHRLPGYWMNRI